MLRTVCLHLHLLGLEWMPDKRLRRCQQGQLRSLCMCCTEVIRVPRRALHRESLVTPLRMVSHGCSFMKQSFSFISDLLGFRPSIGTLDSATNQLPKDGPVVIVTASFEGEPADNAAKFVDWLSHVEGEELSGVRFAVFGCGNHDWVQTYQRIPKLCDELLEQHGGKRLVARGEGDAAASDFFEVFDDFEAKLWEAFGKVSKAAHVFHLYR